MNLGRPALRTVGSLTLVALVGLNVWLLLLNLAKQDRLPASFDRVPGVAAALSDAAEETAAGGAEEDGSVTGDLATDSDGAAAFTNDGSVGAGGDRPGTIQVDDWPGGRGPVPDGPPVQRQVRLLGDGRLALTGSAPSWSLVSDLSGAIGRRLGQDPATIDVDGMVWHPDASAGLGDGDVVLDAPLVYQPGQIELPEGAASSIAPAVALLAAHPELYAVVVGLVDGDAVGAGADDEVSAVALGRTTVVAEVFLDGGIEAERVVTSVAPVADGDDDDDELTGERVLVRIENLLVFGPGS